MSRAAGCTVTKIKICEKLINRSIIIRCKSGQGEDNNKKNEKLTNRQTITDLVPNSISTKPLYQSQSPDSNCSVIWNQVSYSAQMLRVLPKKKTQVKFIYGWKYNFPNFAKFLSVNLSLQTKELMCGNSQGFKRFLVIPQCV